MNSKVMNLQQTYRKSSLKSYDALKNTQELLKIGSCLLLDINATGSVSDGHSQSGS